MGVGIVSPERDGRRDDIQGYLAHQKLQPPQDHHRALGIGLLQGPRRKQFFMREEPAYCHAQYCFACTKKASEIREPQFSIIVGYLARPRQVEIRRRGALHFNVFSSFTSTIGDV